MGAEGERRGWGMGRGRGGGPGRLPEEVTFEQRPEGSEQTATVAAGGSRQHGREK